VTSFALWLLISVLPAQQAPDTLVVCPAAFQQTLTPWLAHRRAQGHVISVIPPARSADGVKRQIQQAAKGKALKYVVLIGDAPEQASPATANTVATYFTPAKANRLWGPEEHIASDHPFALLDGDDQADVAIGRLAVDTPQQLRAVIDRIIRYETERNHGTWRRRVELIAGVGGFGAATDAALEMVTRSLVRDQLPAEYRLQLTYADWRSSYCPPLHEFRDVVVDRFNRGCQFWVYLGHGHRHGLDRIRAGSMEYDILTQRDVPRLVATQGSPIALLIACHSGGYDGSDDCLAESMLQSRHGPVAVIAGSRVTLPYGNTMFCMEMLRSRFQGSVMTIGDVVKHAKRGLVREREDDPLRSALTLMSTLFSPVPADASIERAEHAHLYNLLGDPLLRLSQPEKIGLRVPAKVSAGKTLMIRGISPLEGHAHVELVSQRGSLLAKHKPRGEWPAATLGAELFRTTYHRANDRRVAYKELAIGAGEFTTSLDVPKDASGKCFARIFVQGKEHHAMAAAVIDVEGPAAVGASRSSRSP